MGQNPAKHGSMSWSGALEQSRRRPQLDNRQLLSALKMRYFQLKLLVRSEPSCRLGPLSLIDSLQPRVDFGGRPSAEGLVRSVGVIPVNECDQLRPHRVETERQHDDAHRFVLQRQEEPLDDSETAVLSDRSVARLDSMPLAPSSVLA